MRRNSVIIGFLAITVSLVFCTGMEDPETIGADLITEEALRSHVKFLADDLLEGRGTGSRGMKIAGLYTASQFELNGVEPGGENGTYYQAVPLIEYTATTPVRFEFVRGGRRVALKYFDDFVANCALALGDNAWRAGLVIMQRDREP